MIVIALNVVACHMVTLVPERLVRLEAKLSNCSVKLVAYFNLSALVSFPPSTVPTDQPTNTDKTKMPLVGSHGQKDTAIRVWIMGQVCNTKSAQSRTPSVPVSGLAPTTPHDSNWGFKGTATLKREHHLGVFAQLALLRR